MNPVAQFFDEKALTWDDIHESSGAKHEAVAHLAGVSPKARVLDLGCGTGIMIPAYLALGARSVVGIDVSPKMIARAQQKFADDARVRLHCMNALEFTDDEPFDVAVVYNAYPHFMDKPALVEKIANLLTPRGRFLVAHGMGAQALALHHRHVPANVTSVLGAARDECRLWESRFIIDQTGDAEHFYFFGGRLAQGANRGEILPENARP